MFQVFSLLANWNSLLTQHCDLPPLLFVNGNTNEAKESSHQSGNLKGHWIVFLTTLVLTSVNQQHKSFHTQPQGGSGELLKMYEINHLSVTGVWVGDISWRIIQWYTYMYNTKANTWNILVFVFQSDSYSPSRPGLVFHAEQISITISWSNRKTWWLPTATK